MVKRGSKKRGRNLVSKEINNFGTGYKIIYGTAVEDYKMPGNLVNSFQPFPLKGPSPTHSRTVSNRIPPSHLPPSLISGGALLPDIGSRNFNQPVTQDMKRQRFSRKRKSQHDS